MYEIVNGGEGQEKEAIAEQAVFFKWLVMMLQMLKQCDQSTPGPGDSPVENVLQLGSGER